MCACNLAKTIKTIKNTFVGLEVFPFFVEILFDLMKFDPIYILKKQLSNF